MPPSVCACTAPCRSSEPAGGAVLRRRSAVVTRRIPTDLSGGERENALHELTGARPHMY